VELDKLQYITSSKLFINKNYTKTDPNGLLSEKIFGPINNYKCECGNYNSKTLYENQICPICEVACISSESRYHTWAKIKLLLPIVKKPKIDSILKILKKSNKYLLDPLQTDLTITSHIYLKYNITNDTITTEKKYTSECIPLAITGVYSLFLNLYIIKKYYNSKYAEDLCNCFIEEILVLPPNCRLSLVTEDRGNKKIFKSILDELYGNLINIQQYNYQQQNSYINHEQYYEMVKISLDNDLNTPIIDNQIKDLDRISSYFQFYCNKIYEKVSEVLSGKKGLIRKDFLGKYLDFSSRAIVSVDPFLSAYQVKIPKKSFIRLWYLEYLRYLKCIKLYGLDKIKTLIKKSGLEENLHLEHISDFIEYYLINTDTKTRLVLINRVPTLWRHSIPIVEVVGINEDDVITVSPMIIEQMNMDFDGDTASIFKLHDINAQQELYDNAFQLNVIKYDHNNQYLAQIKNEAVYAFNLLLLTEVNESISPLYITQLSDLPFDYDLILDLDRPVIFNDETYTYGICLLNKWLNLETIQLTKKNDNPQDISNIIYLNSKTNLEYHYNISEINRKLNWLLTAHRTQTLTFELEESCNLLEQCSQNNLLKSLPKNPYIGTHIFEAISDTVIASIPKDYNLIKLLKAKFKKGQFLRSLVSCSYVADDRNRVHHNPINATLLGGLTEDDFFICSIGTRKGLNDKQSLTPQSGYLNRSLIMNLSPLEIVEKDCGTDFGFKIIIKNEQHAKSLINRYYKSDNGDWILADLDFLNERIGETITFRSPITCQTPGFKLCEKCFGNYDIVNKKYIGIHTGAVVSERLTQLSINFLCL